MVALLNRRPKGRTKERGDEANETQSWGGIQGQVAFAACKGDKTLAELATQFGVHPTQITEWKQQLLARVADVFGGTTHKPDMPDLKILHAKIGQLGARPSNGWR